MNNTPNEKINANAEAEEQGIELLDEIAAQNVAVEDENISANTEQDKINELEQKVAELKDLYVRSQAEMQNIQRRSNEEVKKARDYAIASFAKDMVIVKDYLEMALKDTSGNFEAIKTGVDLTLKQLVQTFERQQIKEICPNSKDKLDPHLHQAMTTIETEGAEPNTIIDVMQKGYVLNERVLRPAMVTVTK
ncbi:MAG: nucleotide exchange factor GrpE [Burkholderiales bacterium]|jgi:molecular chaperone GrpE|nr:nucleotide exchange factor GrpE [Burkholderiales bacterium]